MQTSGEQGTKNNAGSQTVHKHAATIVDSDTVVHGNASEAVQEQSNEKQKDQTLASRIGSYNAMRKSANSARQVLNGSQRELEQLSKDFTHKQNILDNYDQIIAEQTQALEQAQNSQAKSQQEQTSLQDELKNAQSLLEQTKAKNKKELEPIQRCADEAKHAVRVQEKELAHLQKERDSAAKALYDVKRRLEARNASDQSPEYDRALANNQIKMQEVGQAHSKLGELRNAYAQTKAALASKQTEIAEEEKPLYEEVERLQSSIKGEKRNISRQEKLIAAAQNALDEANNIYENPQGVLDLEQKVQDLTQEVKEQQEHYDVLKAQVQDAAKKAHIGKLVASGIILLVAIIAIVLIVLFAGR